MQPGDGLGRTISPRIASVAHALPSRLVTNDDVIEMALERSWKLLDSAQRTDLEASLNSLFDRVGATTRYHRAAHENAVDLGTVAAQRALNSANVSPENVDLLIYAGVSRGFLEPATANVFHDSLGLRNATCFDVLDACASWLRAFDVAVHLLRGEAYRNALIINCEFNFEEHFPVLDSMSRFGELEAGFTIGEAATATFVDSIEESRNYVASFRNAGAGNALCQIPLPHASSFLNGSHVEAWRPMEFYVQSAKLHAMAISSLEAQYREDERINGSTYDIILSHSAGLPASKIVTQRLRLDKAKHFEIFPRYGNIVSASLPLSMSLALEEGRLRHGDDVLFVVGSAGVTSAIALLEF